MKKYKILAVVSIVLTNFGSSACAPPAPKPIPITSGPAPTQSFIPLPPQYFSPVKSAEYVSKDTTITVRYGPILTKQLVYGLNFIAQGESSGAHDGQTILADDQKTVIFKPNQPFTPGEQVKVSVNSLTYDPETIYSPLAYTFNVAANQQPGGVGASTQPLDTLPQSAFPDDLTVPQDIPHFTVTAASPATANEGDIFVAPFPWTRAVTGSYLLILDGQGQLVYYQSMAGALNAYDFKPQPGERLSFYSQKDAVYYVMDSHYQIVDKYQMGNGYTTDLHDLQLLPNGNALLMAYDAETVNMSQVAPGGLADATVTGLIIQELDPSKNVIFEWRSWDHFAFINSTASLAGQTIDLIHGNALALANDGNLLLSSRNLSEITKIDLQTGAVLWRLGGKANQFVFVNDQPFAYQHDVRQLPNGDITVFDNQGTQEDPAPSRAIEYRIDEVHKTVTKVWQYQPSPTIFTTFMGDTHSLADGNTFLDWGSPFTQSGYEYVSMTEVNPDDQVLFQLAFDQPFVSYRAFRSPWQGFPLTKPALAYKQDANGLTLGYSWNGATEVVSWRVLGGRSLDTLNLIEQKPINGFETQSQLTNLPKGECYFQAVPVDKNGSEMARSQIISTDAAACPLNPKP